MKNEVEISSDGMNVYLSACVRASTLGKVILSVMNIVVLGVYIWGLSAISKEDTGKMLIPIILMFIVFIFFPWKYWFWNFFGKETIIINTRTILIQIDYGIVKIKPKIIPHNQLAMEYEFVREIEGEEYGKIKFISYNLETNLPELIGESTVLIPKHEIDKAIEFIVNLYKIDLENHLYFSAN